MEKVNYSIGDRVIKVKGHQLSLTGEIIEVFERANGYKIRYRIQWDNRKASTWLTSDFFRPIESCMNLGPFKLTFIEFAFTNGTRIYYVTFSSLHSWLLSNKERYPLKEGTLGCAPTAGHAKNILDIYLKSAILPESV